MPWCKITLTDTQRSVHEDERLIAAFQKVYDRYRSRVPNLALFRLEQDCGVFFLNASASRSCGDIKERYLAEEARPIRHLRRLAGEGGP
jgi:hypothetical protein